MIHRFYLNISATFGALAVIIGAFGAHSLKAKLSPEALEVYKTGVDYHFYHSLALFGVSILSYVLNDKRLKYAILFFSLGILFFSGSLYFIATKELHGIAIGLLGLITPLGGLMFILGWAMLFNIGLGNEK
jgi:uncharacterized membrane protein YgdD (TMEM256/DUF423 family)